MASLANLWLPCVVGLVACAAVSLVVGKPWRNRRRGGAEEDPPEDRTP